MAALIAGLCGSRIACCAASAALQVCCSISGCFSCKSNRLSKLVYALIFTLSAGLGIALRYKGQEMLSSWTKYLDVCNSATNQPSCWGLQACYRVSAAVCGFFFTLAPLVALYPPAHLGAWFLKVIYYLGLLFVTLAMPNSFFSVYADISRYASVLFLVAQVLIIIDMAYKIHEGLLARMEKREAAMAASNWEPGLCSNGWRLLYLFLSFMGIGASIAGLGLLYHFFGSCGLAKFFISETLVVGIVSVVLSMLPAIAKGVLPASLLFAYNTYLCYGAISNNPDPECNVLAAGDQRNTAAIIAGVVIAVLSVSWAAYSSAGSFASVVTMGAVPKPTPEEEEAEEEAAIAADEAADRSHVNVLATAGGRDIEMASGAGTGKAKAAAADGSAAAYAAGAAAARADPIVDGGQRASDKRPDRRAWLFHIIMSLGGLYLAMVLTNWGDDSKVNVLGANPELSTASMWVKMAGGVWLIQILYVWSLIAPLCCRNRDFS